MFLNLSLALTLAALTTQESEPRNDSISLGDGGRIVYQVRSSPFKCYVAQLRTPAGIDVLEDAPSDHLHHHGLMLALGVDDVDFWDESDPAQCGTQNPQTIQFSLPTLSLGEVGELKQKVSWENPRGESLLLEERTVRAARAGEGAPTLLTWRSILSLVDGRPPARLWGQHYFGLGMRFHPDAKGNGAFFNDGEHAGTVVAGDERLTPARWVAFSTTIGEKPVTVAMFDHPLNPRSPANFFTMCHPFAYLTATSNLHVQERILRPGEQWDLRYGVAAWDGHVAAEEIEKVYGGWLRAFGEEPENVALATAGATAFASSEYGPAYAAGRAIDGRWSIREQDKWNSKANITPHYLRIDLGQERSIDTVVLRHEGSLPLPDSQVFNSSDFRVQHSRRAWGPWIDLVPPIRDNTDNVTMHRFPPTSTRFVRILLETAEQGDRNEYGRLAEVEVYASTQENN